MKFTQHPRAFLLFHEPWVVLRQSFETFTNGGFVNEQLFDGASAVDLPVTIPAGLTLDVALEGNLFTLQTERDVIEDLLMGVPYQPKVDGESLFHLFTFPVSIDPSSLLPEGRNKVLQEWADRMNFRFGHVLDLLVLARQHTDKIFGQTIYVPMAKRVELTQEELDQFYKDVSHDPYWAATNPEPEYRIPNLRSWETKSGEMSRFLNAGRTQDGIAKGSKVLFVDK